MVAIARNLRVSGRRQRLLMGVGFIALAVVGAALCIAGGLPRGTRMVLFLPFYLGMVGLWQYRDHT